MPPSLFLLFFPFFLLVTAATNGYCHPHTFVIASYSVEFDGQGLKGIRVSWKFDEMYSATTAADFDLDGNGSFSENESAELIALGNESLPGVNYFTNIQIEGKPYEVNSVSDFSISYEKGILSYTFFVDCPVKAAKKVKNLKISPYDQELFVALFFDQNQPFTLENSDQYNVVANVKEDKDTLIYFNSIHPETLFLEFKKK